MLLHLMAEDSSLAIPEWHEGGCFVFSRCGVGNSAERGWPRPQPSTLQLTLSKNKFIPACPMWRPVRNTRKILISRALSPIRDGDFHSGSEHLGKRRKSRQLWGPGLWLSEPESAPCHLCPLLQSLEMTVTAWHPEDHQPPLSKKDSRR